MSRPTENEGACIAEQRRRGLASTMLLALLALVLPGGIAIADDAALAQASVIYPPEAVVSGIQLQQELPRPGR